MLHDMIKPIALAWLYTSPRKRKKKCLRTWMEIETTLSQLWCDALPVLSPKRNQ